jgi:peptide/nickel transport system permease protein
MLSFVGRRLLACIPLLVLLSVLLFAFVRALPGSPAHALLGERATEESVADIEAQLGLDKPLLEQYRNFVGNVLRGDLGVSVHTRRPVADELVERFPATLELTLAAMTIAVLFGVPLGFVAAKRHQGLVDNSSLVASLLGMSIPVFFLALLLKYVFSVKLGWLPSLGRASVTSTIERRTNFYLLDAALSGGLEQMLDVLGHMILPAIALSTIPLAVISRITRASVLDVLNDDYIRTARAKGLGHLTIDQRHVLRNAVIPVVTVIGLQTGLLLTGAILTETVFSWPGLGTWILDAIQFRDYAVLQAGILFCALIVVFSSLVVDVCYALLNPRIRYQ